MGLYLHSHPMDRFFKRSIRRGSKCFYLLKEYSILSSSWNRFITILPFFIVIKEKVGSLWIFFIFFSILYWRMYAYTFILHPFLSFDGRVLVTTQDSQLHFVRTASIESLHLSCIYSFFWKAGVGSGLPVFWFQGFSEFESSHLVGFPTKAQPN